MVCVGDRLPDQRSLVLPDEKPRRCCHRRAGLLLGPLNLSVGPVRRVLQLLDFRSAGYNPGPLKRSNVSALGKDHD